MSIIISRIPGTILFSLVSTKKGAKLHAQANGYAACGAGKIQTTRVCTEGDQRLICKKCAPHFQALANRIYQGVISEHKPIRSKIQFWTELTGVIMDIVDGIEARKEIKAPTVEQLTEVEAEAEYAREYEEYWNARAAAYSARIAAKASAALEIIPEGALF